MAEPLDFDDDARELLREIGAYASLRPEAVKKVADRLRGAWRSGSTAAETAIREHRERVVGSPVPDPF